MGGPGRCFESCVGRGDQGEVIEEEVIEGELIKGEVIK